MEAGLRLDRAGALLSCPGLGAFDAAARRWQPDGGVGGEPVTLRAAVCWLQTESGTPCRVPIGVIGARDASAEARETAFVVGKGLAECGLILLCGGKTGVMEAVCAGSAAAGGLSIGLLPDDEWTGANPYVSIPIATGIGVARNAIIARAALALIAIGGGYGTVSEMAFALQFGRPVLTLLTPPPIAGVHPCATPDAALESVFRIVLALPSASSETPPAASTRHGG